MSSQVASIGCAIYGDRVPSASRSGVEAAGDGAVAAHGVTVLATVLTRYISTASLLDERLFVAL